jgi:hypothetical protein
MDVALTIPSDYTRVPIYPQCSRGFHGVEGVPLNRFG